MTMFSAGRGACRLGQRGDTGVDPEVLLRATARRMEKLVGDIGENRGTARGNSALCDEPEEPGEKLVDVDAGVEFEFGEQLSGKVLRVVLEIN